MRLVDMPDEVRMMLRDLLESCGAIIDGYDGEDFMVCCPRDFQPFHSQVRMAGFQRTYCAFFPLGTDRAPDEYRHDGPYPGCRGYWMQARYRFVGGA